MALRKARSVRSSFGKWRRQSETFARRPDFPGQWCERLRHSLTRWRARPTAARAWGCSWWRAARTVAGPCGTAASETPQGRGRGDHAFDGFGRRLDAVGRFVPVVLAPGPSAVSSAISNLVAEWRWWWRESSASLAVVQEAAIGPSCRSPAGRAGRDCGVLVGLGPPPEPKPRRRHRCRHTRGRVLRGPGLDEHRHRSGGRRNGDGMPRKRAAHASASRQEMELRLTAASP